jgi:hypothetical protein
MSPTLSGWEWVWSIHGILEGHSMPVHPQNSKHTSRLKTLGTFRGTNRLDCSARFLETLTENSVRPMADVIPPNEPQSSSGLRPCLSLVNEIRRCASVQGSTVFGHRCQSANDRQRAAWQIRALSGSPSFVAVVQSTDLRERYDLSQFWRLNGSGLGRVLCQREMSP